MLSGFDELINTLDNLGQVGKQISDKTLKEGAKIVLEEEKRQAPKLSGGGAEALAVGTIKKYSSGNAFVSVGINYKNWEQCKGLWFQNYNGVHSSGKHVGWISRAFENSKSNAENTMLKYMSNEVDKILRS